MSRCLVYKVGLCREVERTSLSLHCLQKTASGGSSLFSISVGPITFDAYFAIAGVDLPDSFIPSSHDPEKYPIERDSAAATRVPRALIERHLGEFPATTPVAWFCVKALQPRDSHFNAEEFNDAVLLSVTDYALEAGLNLKNLKYIPYSIPFKGAFGLAFAIELAQLAAPNFKCPGFYDIPESAIFESMKGVTLTCQEFSRIFNSPNHAPEADLVTALPWAYIQLRADAKTGKITPHAALHSGESAFGYGSTLGFGGKAPPSFARRGDAVIRVLSDVMNHHSNIVLFLIEIPSNCDKLHLCDGGSATVLGTLFDVKLSDFGPLGPTLPRKIFTPVYIEAEGSEQEGTGATLPTLLEAARREVSISLAIASITNAPIPLCLFNQFFGKRQLQVAAHFVASSLIRDGYTILPFEPPTSEKRSIRIKRKSGKNKKAYKGGDVAPGQRGVYFSVESKSRIFNVDYRSFYVSIFCERGMCVTCPLSAFEQSETLPVPASLDTLGPVPAAMLNLMERRRNTTDLVLKDALKLVGNGTYGAFGSPSFRFHVLPLAAATAFWSRFYINRLRADIRKYCCRPEDKGVLLSVTDSVVFQTTRLLDAATLTEVLQHLWQTHGYKVLALGEIGEWKALWVHNKQCYAYLEQGQSKVTTGTVRGLAPRQSDEHPKVKQYILEAITRVLRGDTAEQVGSWLSRLVNTLAQFNDADESARRIRTTTLNLLASDYSDLYAGAFTPSAREAHFPSEIVYFVDGKSKKPPGGGSRSNNQRKGASITWWSPEYFKSEMALVDV